MLVCMYVTSVSIPHFVPIISKGMWHNTTIHTSTGAIKGLGEQEAEDAQLTEMEKRSVI